MGLLGFLIAFMGALPWLDEYNVLPDICDFIPREAPIYNIIIVVLGIILIGLAFKERSF